METLVDQINIENYRNKIDISMYIATGNPGYLEQYGIPIPDIVDISLDNGLKSIRKVSNTFNFNFCQIE